MTTKLEQLASNLQYQTYRNSYGMSSYDLARAKAEYDVAFEEYHKEFNRVKEDERKKLLARISNETEPSKGSQ